MRIKMFESRRGAEDGHVVKRFEKGQEYDVADTLARTFLKHGYAQVVDPDAQALGTLDRVTTDFNRLFRPQPTRGSAPTNPSTLAAKDLA